MTSNETTSTRAEDRTAVRDVLQELYAAWADNDADAFAALYLDDATVVMPGVFHQGRSTRCRPPSPRTTSPNRMTAPSAASWIAMSRPSNPPTSTRW
jgi:hypothetical protein